MSRLDCHRLLADLSGSYMSISDTLVPSDNDYTEDNALPIYYKCMNLASVNDFMGIRCYNH